mgnify:CR=1 FL=1
MSRIAKNPVTIPAGVELTLNGNSVSVKGAKGTLSMDMHTAVSITQEDGQVQVAARDGSKIARSMSGTARSLINNMVVGVNEGFSKTLVLQGVGYRAAAKGEVLSLTLGFSHPVEHQLPEGITAETPNQTTIVVTGADKQKVGQVAAEIRGYRPPERYKGKGARCTEEFVRRKEAKKK